MPISLRYADQPLNTPLAFDNTTLRDAADMDAANTSQFGRGWVSAGMGDDAGALADKALQARIRGDAQGEAVYMQQARDLAARAQQWAPTVQNLTDVNGLRSGADWLGGAMGNIRTSVPSLMGGVAGTLAGVGVGALTRNPQLGLRATQGLSFLGAAIPGYGMERNEAAMGAMTDPYALANKTPEEIDRAVTMKALGNAALEAIVPAGVGRMALKGLGKRAVAKEIAKDAGEEFLTEGAQSLGGQATQNYLDDKALTDFDYKQAFNEGAAGAVGGGMMGTVGAAAGAAKDKLSAGADKAREIKGDPLGTIIDAGVDLAGKAGAAKAKLDDYLDGKLSGKTQEERDRELLDNIMGARQTSPADAVRDDEMHLDDLELAAKRKEEARAAGWDESSGKSWLDHSRDLREQAEVKAAHDASNDMLRAIEGKSKKSLMRPVLTDDFGEQEGRDMSADKVTDDFGTATRSPTWDSGFSKTDPARAKIMADDVATKEGVKKDSSATTSVAKVLQTQGYKENLIAAAKNQGVRDADLKNITNLLHWGSQYGFNRENEVVPQLAKTFGDKAAKMFRKAYDAGVSEGLFQRDDEKAARIEERLTKDAQSSKMLGDVLVANLRPTVRAELDSHGKPGSPSYAKALAGLISEVRRVVNKGAKGGSVKQKSGRRSVNDDKIMQVLFGKDEKNVSAIVDAFYSAEQAFKSKGAVNDEKADINDEDDGRAYEESNEESGNEARTKVTRTYHGFHLTNSKALDDKVASIKEAGTVHRVGMKTALLDQHATKLDTEAADLSPKERVEALEDAVLKEWPELKNRKPGGIRPDANEATKLLYRERVAEWRKLVEVRANTLERKYSAPMTTSEEIVDTLANQFDMTAIKALRLDGGLDGRSVELGNIVFKLKTGGDFVTSAPMIMRKMFRVQGEMGYNGYYHKDIKGGTVQNANAILMDGIGSMLENTDYFTGEFGYVKGGKFVALKGKAEFPAEFRIMGSGENTVTWGASKEASTAVRENLKSNDFDKDEAFATGLKKIDPSAFDKIEALKAAVRAGTDKVDVSKLNAFLKAYQAAFFEKLANTPQGKLLIASKEAARNASRSVKAIHKLNAEIAKLKAVTTWQYEGENGKTQKQFNGWLDGWVKLALPKGLTVTEQIPGKEDNGTAVDGLAAYDPATEIVRDARGDVQTSNVEMAAQGRIGKSNVGTAPVATWKVAPPLINATGPRERGEKLAPDTLISGDAVKADPARKMKRQLGDQIAARDWIAQLLNKGIPAFSAALKKFEGDVEVRKRLDAGMVALSKMSPSGLIDNVLSVSKEEAAKIIGHAKRLAGDQNVDVGLNDVEAGAAGVRGQVDEVGRPGGETVRPAADQQGPAAKADVGTGTGQSTGAARSGVGEKETEVVFNTGKNFKPYKFAKYVPANGEKTSTRSKRDPNEPVPPKLSNPLSLIIKLGGIDPSEALDLTGERAVVANRKRPGLFRKGGLSADGIREALNQAGWINDSIEEARALIDDIYRGEEVVHPDEVADLKDWEQAMQQYEHEKQSGEMFSKQKADVGKEATNEEQEAVRDHLFKVLGPKIEVEFAKTLADGASGEWTPQSTQNLIKLALNGDVMGTAFHESFHELMDILRKQGANTAIDQLLRVAKNPMVLRQLDRLLEGHPEAQQQVRKNREEAAAFMYQFWAQGKLKLGGETKGVFQKIKDFLAKVTGFVSDEVKRMEMDELQVRKMLEAFHKGAVANMDTRNAVVAALNADAEAHEKALKNVGGSMGELQTAAAKLVFSAEAMIEATGNVYMKNLSSMFHQMAGKAMGEQSYMDGVRENTNRYMNKLEDVLNKYDPADLELARQGLANGDGKRPGAVEAGKAYDEIKAFFKEMADYLDTKDVRRLDIINGQPTWVKVDWRKHYWPQVWDMEFVEKNVDQLRKDLLEHHGDVLAKIAKEAEAEIKAGKGAGEGTASSKALEDGVSTVTPEMIADAIIVRLQNTNGQQDINEDVSDMGITPMASAVNRRTLDWLDPEVFDKYKSKDIARIMTSYTVNMTKRAEYQSRFGYGGEKIRDQLDKAVLDEIGGTELVEHAEDNLDAAIDDWKKAAAKWHEDHPGEKYPVPYPTLRSVGIEKHRADAKSADEAKKAERDALKKLEQAVLAVSAMEGTLGRDITPQYRTFSSWMVTYQNFTKLSTMLFTSFQDVMGIVANGGEMNDAWDAFVAGIKEIKNSWKGEKDTSKAMQRAEFWGTVDAMALQDALGQAYGSAFMTSKAKRWSDKFFKWTGAEGWNRGVRAVATQVAERTILDWKQNGLDRSDKAAVARFERLFGKFIKPEDIKVLADGSLDPDDHHNKAAVTRWVLDAVPTTSAAHRPIWGSDPHFQMFIQFKNYTYSFHRILLKGAIEQAKLGNYRPAMVLAVGYMPIAIAGGAIKEMLIPGEEPPWMQGGLDDYLSYGFTRAGVLGVPQMYAQNLYDLDPAATFGPAVDQLQNLLSVPLLDNRTAMGEALGALPAGNLLRRLDKLGN